MGRKPNSSPPEEAAVPARAAASGAAPSISGEMNGQASQPA
jgi:hypothetical protein